MNTLATWLEDLQRVHTLRTDHLNPCKLIQHTRTLDKADLRDTLSALGPVTGWVMEASRVVIWMEQVLTLNTLPISAEFYHSQEHWTLHYAQGGKWHLDHARCTPCPVEEATHVSERVHHLHVGRFGQSSLVYQRLWAFDQNGLEVSAPEVRIALFSGFEEKVS